MFPASFEYHRASSVEEALNLLGQHEDAKLLAGGHSLLPMMKLRLAQPALLVDIGRVEGLRGISRDGDSIRIGALTTHHELATSDVLKEGCPLLAEAAAKIGDPQVRNKGTVGGNIAHADPASDLPAVLCALGAKVHLQGQGGDRTVASGDFFVDLLETALGEEEILTAIEVTAGPPRSGSAYLKVEHPASGYAICGAAALVHLGDDGKIACASLAFNGVSATPTQAIAVGDALAGQGAEAIDAAIAHVTVDEPLSDVHASGEYRTHLARVYGKRALRLALERAGS